MRYSVFDDKRILEKTSLWQIYDWVQKRTFQTRLLCLKSNKMVLALKPSFFNIVFHVRHRKKLFWFQNHLFWISGFMAKHSRNFFWTQNHLFWISGFMPKLSRNFFGLKNSFFEYQVLCPISVIIKMVTNSYFIKVGFYAQNRI